MALHDRFIDSAFDAIVISLSINNVSYIFKHLISSAIYKMCKIMFKEIYAKVIDELG